MSLSIKPSNIKVLMIIIIFALVVASGAGFYFFQDYFAKEYPQTSTTQQGAITTQPSTIDQMTAEKAQNLFFTKIDYQTKLNDDIQTYSKVANITTPAIEFSDLTVSSLSNSLQRSLVTIKINESVQYNDFIKFLKSLETNLPKIQPNQVTISPVAGSSDKINVESLIVEVYIR